MTHIRHINDSDGELSDIAWFCSDFCNRDWNPNGLDKYGNAPGNRDAEGVEPYGGWNGCHENEHTEECAGCGEIIEGGDSHD